MKIKIDLYKFQNNCHEAAVANTLQVNSLTKSVQGWLLTLATAELAFLGALLLNYNFDDKLFCDFLSLNVIIFISISLLLISFGSFFIGCYFQIKYMLQAARKNHKLSLDTHKYIKQNNIIVVEEMPSCLSDNDIDQMETNDIANKSFLYSAACVFVSTVLITLIAFVILI